jgi:hypothetical protein
MTDATELPGKTTAAGEDVPDQEFSSEVAEQTDSDLQVEGAFERESQHSASDTEIAKASADELAG